MSGANTFGQMEVGGKPPTIDSEYLRLVCEEPFRVFFPAGVLLGVVGVSLWVVFYLGMRVPSTGSGFS